MSTTRKESATPIRPAVEPIVLDGSVALAWLFHDEKDAYADKIVKRLPDLVFFVPRLWHMEIANVLLVGERRGRCTQSDIAHWLAFLNGLPIVVDGETESQAWTETVALSRQHGLSSYDAAYLELALREGIPLATLDAKLKAAAKKTGVRCYKA